MSPFSQQSLVQSILGANVELISYEIGGERRRGWRVRQPADDDPWKDSALECVEASWRALAAEEIALFVGPAIMRLIDGRWVDTWDAGWPEPQQFSQIFALPGASVADIVEFCEVGSHNVPSATLDEMLARLKQRGGIDPFTNRPREISASIATASRRLDRAAYGNRPWRATQLALADIFSIAPFNVQFADQAGLKATFLSNVTRDAAEQIGKTILALDSDVADTVVEDLEALGEPVPVHPEIPDMPNYAAALTEYILAAGRFRLWWD